jgi:hypothetical protein
VSLAGAELAMRRVLPWLLPRAESASAESGLPLGWFESRQRTLLARSPRPDLVVIGDSFVETGEWKGGWIEELRRAAHLRVEVFGSGGACPSQYWYVFDHLRRAGLTAPVLVVLYIGNDFSEEAAWATLGSDRTGYRAARKKLVADPARPTFYPCFAIEPRGPAHRFHQLLERDSALYRALQVAAKGRAPERMMMDRCDKAPWAERVAGRLFFLLRHDPMLNPGDLTIRRAHEDVLAGFGRHRNDPGLLVAPVLDREETCSAVHGRPVYRAAAFADRLRGLGLRVLDANAVMARACAEEDLYAPDGHWNRRGHQVFARALTPLLAQAGLGAAPLGHVQ